MFECLNVGMLVCYYVCMFVSMFVSMLVYIVTCSWYFVATPVSKFFWRTCIRHLVCLWCIVSVNFRPRWKPKFFWHWTVSKVGPLNFMCRCSKQSCVHRRFTVQTFFFACSDDGTMFPLSMPTWPFSKWTPCVVGRDWKRARFAMQTRHSMTEVWAAKICCRCNGCNVVTVAQFGLWIGENKWNWTH